MSCNTYRFTMFLTLKYVAGSVCFKCARKTLGCFFPFHPSENVCLRDSSDSACDGRVNRILSYRGGQAGRSLTSMWSCRAARNTAWSMVMGRSSSQTSCLHCRRKEYATACERRSGWSSPECRGSRGGAPAFSLEREEVHCSQFALVRAAVCGWEMRRGRELGNGQLPADHEARSGVDVHEVHRLL